MVGIERERVGDLLAVVERAMPDERLTGDELLSVCFDDPGVVLATPDGDGFASGVTRSFDERTVGYVRLLAVVPEAQRSGLGAALLAATEEWAFDNGATEVQLGGSAPFYFWPGVDAEMVGMLCLAESAGYDVVGADLNMALASTFRAEVPAGVVIRRALDDVDVDALIAFVTARWPWWVDELRRAVDQGGAFGAWVDGATPSEDVALGFVCHSVNRLGWLGPMGTDPARQHGGVGHALLARACTDLMVANVADVEIAWVGPIRFYAKAGAHVSRTFRAYRKLRP